MASSDQDEVYDVERILAERLENGVTRYLVKWQNYPDDQCTWEPAENFDTSETLATWTKQKELGDVLEQDDLQRIQSQMDAFQATLTSTGESEEGHDTSEGDSDVDFDQLQPPKKRLRMVGWEHNYAIYYLSLNRFMIRPLSQTAHEISSNPKRGIVNRPVTSKLLRLEHLPARSSPVRTRISSLRHLELQQTPIRHHGR